MNLTLIGIRKFWTRSATIVSLIIAVALLALEFVAIGASYRTSTQQTGLDTATLTWFLVFPSAFDAILVLLFEFVAIIGLIYIVTAAGSEWTWGTLKVAVARGQSRWQYTISTFASLSIILLIGMLLAFLAGIVAVIIGASIAGLSFGNLADPAELGQVFIKLVRCGIALISLCSVGYVVAMVTKNQMAGIGVVIAYFVLSIVSEAVLPEVVRQVLRYQPFNVAADAIGLQGPPTAAGAASSTANSIEPNLAMAFTVFWLVLCLVVAAISVERAEITN
jgi:ABC-type transport system involved in multi-copper enzyme maturation permease subunit